MDGLASLIQQENNSSFTRRCRFFILRNRQDRFKLLYWDGDGFFSVISG
ncbi:IS66 family insertion sequence element accessory protein TnpB [Enterococcus faecium]|nr:transposase [Enterococcus faecium]